MRVVVPDSSLEAKKKDLWFICTVSNPQQWRSRYRLYRDFRRHITEELGCNLLTVECALGAGGHHAIEVEGDQPCRSDVLPNGVRTIDVPVRNNSWLWIKENCLNIGVRFLPPSADTLVFADADIRFQDPQMPLNTIYHLNGTFKVVQPFESCADLGPNGEIMGMVHKSFGWCYQNGLVWRKKSGGYSGSVLPGQNPFHPGYCLAMRKSTYQKLDGLLECGVAGAGDHHMATALIGRAAESFPKGIHDNYKAAVLKWEKRAQEVVNKSYGWINGTILHGFHGSKKRRAYIERWDILVKNRYDPLVDIYRNSDGVLELTNQNGTLRDELQAYFRSRNEDEGGESG